MNEFGSAGAAWFSGLVESGTRWWGFLTLVSGANIAVWFLLYRQLHEQPAGSGSLDGMSSGTGLMLLLSAAYVFGCAFRSFLPRADVQRICLFDTWLSSVVVGRSVATVAEIAFAAQWAIMLHQLGTMTGAETVLIAAWVIVPLILIAECFSWYAVLTTHYLYNASKIRYGPLPSSSSGSAFAGCCRSSMVRFAWPSPSRLSGSSAIWRFS